MLNYHHLRYFWLVAHEGNLTRAAKKCHIAQSALSMQIDALEVYFGQPLFERTGRTLVLTTSLKALSVIGEELTQVLSDVSSIEVLQQGQWPKRRLMERFRQGSDGGAPGCVLVASASFWEGFDVPGQALQLLIIDKLPFPSPVDPLVKAKGNRLQAQGKNAFSDHSLPEAIVALKQGAGRLIRHETDRGGLLIADNRLLPMMQQIAQTDDFWDALVSITTASTKAS